MTAWACPACGLERSLEVVREAVSLERTALTCAMVPVLTDNARLGPVPGVRAMLAEVVLERARQVAAGERTADGCGLLWVSHVDGRQVWAAEAEALAALVEA